MNNKLFYGDNLTIMRGMPLQCVDLIYLDPPFNSKRNYNIMYRTMTGRSVPEQVEAFCDTWTLDPEKEQAARQMPVLMREHGVPDYYVEFWRLWMQALRYTQPHLLAYLIYMVERLLQMKSILKPTGSIYLHCDPTTSHYIKVMMDGIFRHQNFRNEIVWKRTSAHSDAGTMGSVHDVILYYSKSSTFTFNRQHVSYGDSYIERRHKHSDKDGRRWMDGDLSAKGLTGGGYGYEYKGANSVWRVPLEGMKELDSQNRLYFTSRGGIRIKRYLDEMKGVSLSDVWTDIPPINSQAKERLGYPTQKPVALLKRIIDQSSNPGDVVFDPFCGCGTTIYAAQENGRKWIGCDIAILAVRLVAEQLENRHGIKEEDYEIDGVPVSFEQALELFKHDPFQFEHWAVERVGGFPNEKKVADRGIDGRIYFDSPDGLKSMVLSVKGGNIRPTDIRDLRGVLDRESSIMAGFVCNREPTLAMKREAAMAGTLQFGLETYPCIQLLTTREIFEGKMFRCPVKVASKIKSRQGAFDWI